MTTEFKITLTEDDTSDKLIPYSNAIERDHFLWHLKHNFFREWKHADTDPSLEEIKEKLFQALEEYNVLLPN